ncbi:sulfite exporter TauE/SafE family protein [Ramlibacter albus]|uniref:Probable membrane transporter protein n=1 Tax=Ramlibacter albus TaxID=2079448 RepID=A0A923S452_9BURK|nr:sulfite exporter TauE/SafE family protein [Ramlibacter albus]MBC5767121.1 sulfite exporter TauE/SafE family protein [Ramlibacter albus]
MFDWSILFLAEPTFVAAYTVFGMVGFGATLVAAPVLAHVLPVSTLIPAQSLLDFAAASSNGLRLGAHLDKRELKRLLPPIVIGCVIGAYALLAVPVRTMMLLLGIFVVGYALNGLRPKPERPPISSRWAWWYGATGGVLSAMFGAGGWVYSIYLARRLEDPQAIRATQVAVLTATSFIRVSLFAIAGRYFDLNLLLLSLCLAPAMLLGLWMGNRITLGMDKKRFMQVLYVVLLLTGVSLVARTLAS